MLGISVYAGMENKIEDIIDYIDKASKLGIKTVFSSAHIPEVDENFERDFETILEECSKRDMTTIIDISKGYFDRLDIDKYNIDYLRLDYGFTIKEAASMSQKYGFGISVNATTFSKEQIKEFEKYGGDLEKINACHNFYPRKGTGISEELFIEKNQLFNRYGVKTMAFITSNHIRRGPVYEGLPTMEIHRDTMPIVAAQHLLELGVDYAVIGDAMASDKELKELSLIEDEVKLIPLRVSEELSEVELDLLKQVHRNREDPGAFAIRSQESRLIKKGKIIPKNNDLLREKYSVTIDNEGYDRYEGELEILLKDLETDSRINVVGDGSEGSILIDRLKPGEKFKFILLED